MPLRLLILISAVFFAGSAQAIEHTYHGAIYTAQGETSGRLRSAVISPLPSGQQLIQFHGDAGDFEITVPTYSDASALVNDVREGAEIRCDETVAGALAIICTAFNVTI